MDPTVAGASWEGGTSPADQPPTASPESGESTPKPFEGVPATAVLGGFCIEIEEPQAGNDVRKETSAPSSNDKDARHDLGQMRRQAQLMRGEDDPHLIFRCYHDADRKNPKHGHLRRRLQGRLSEQRVADELHRRQQRGAAVTDGHH